VYNEKILNGEEKYIIKWKSYEEYQHVKYEYEYNKYLISKGKLETSGGTITTLIGKTLERNLLSKETQLSTTFHMLSRGCLMIDYQDCMKYPSLLQV
jgi:hypothetical protein